MYESYQSFASVYDEFMDGTDYRLTAEKIRHIIMRYGISRPAELRTKESGDMDVLLAAEMNLVVDLGCGTGLELGYYYEMVPTALVTGIDLAPGMLEALRKKFPEKALLLIQGSYFDVPFQENAFDAAVSVESLHHFTKEEKIPLYAKLWRALKPGGFFILTDYFAGSDEEEQSRREELLRLRKEQKLPDEEFYHFDTPLTVEHEKEALLAAGFSSVTVLENWGPTYTLKAEQ